MKRVVQTLAIHFCCIIFFTFFYYYFSRNFDNNKRNKFTHYNGESKLASMIDYFLLSTTIQSSVGLTDIFPISVFGKLLIIIQQLIMISINVITLYIFTT